MSTNPLTLYMLPGNQRVESASPFCVKVARGLNYKKLPYTSQFHGRRLKALGNPLGKLPVLQHGNDLLADSTTILAWLDKHTPAPRLIPSDPTDAARARILEDWADQSLYFILMFLRWSPPDNYARYKADFIDNAPLGTRRLLSRRRVLKQLVAQGIGKKDHDHVLGDLRQLLDDLQLILDTTPFLVGQTLSVADLAAFAMIGGLCVGPTPEAERLVKEREPLWAWIQRVDAATRNGNSHK